MTDRETLFFELIRVSLGTQSSLSRQPSSREWGKLYKLAEKQSLLGVCFAGLQNLGADADEGYARIGVPEEVYFQWVGMAAQIQQRNEEVNQQCIELQMRLAAEGFRSCVLKGQGVAKLYGKQLCPLRQSGDIDIWMDGGFEKVNAWVQVVAPTKIVNQHHVALKVFEDTEVEAHYHPINMTNPCRQRLMKAFIKSHEDECLSIVDDGQLHVPTREFNLVFLMAHIFHHLFTEGVGLRQVMDYYFAVRTEGLNDTARKTVHDLGLDRFASALMWVLGFVFGLPEDEMIWQPCENDGRFLLDEILLSGNFGKQDKRQTRLYKSKWKSFWMIHMKTFRFWRFDHWAWLWSPIERVRGYLWRRLNGYRQY